MPEDYKNKDWLEEQYIKQNKTAKQIAIEQNRNPNLIRSYINQFKLLKHTRKPRIKDITEEMNKFGSPGKWAQEEARKNYASHRYLADQFLICGIGIYDS